MRSSAILPSCTRVPTLCFLVGSVLCAPGAAYAQNEALPPAAELIERSIDALGGRDAFAGLKNRKMTGSFLLNQPPSNGTFIIHEAAPRFRQSVMDSVATGRMENGTNGEICWQITPLGPRILDGAEKRMCLREARFNPALHWKELYEKAECTGIEEVEGRRCYRVVATPAGEDAEVTHYDCESFVPRKATMTVDGPMGKMQLEQLLEDYRRVDGILMPHKVRQLNRTFGQSVEIRFERIEHNVKMPDDVFAPPQSVQQLLERQQTTTAPAARTAP